MEEAYKNNDQMTLNIVRNAVDSQINGLYFSSSDKRLENLKKQWDNKNYLEMDFLDNSYSVMKAHNYDFIPDPAIFTDHAAVMQRAIESEQPLPYKTGIVLNKFEKNRQYLINNYTITERATPPLKPRLDSNQINNEKHKIRMTILSDPIIMNDHKIAENMIAYLELIKLGWDKIQIDNKVHNKNNVDAPRKLIDDTIIQIKRDPSLKNINMELNILRENLSLSIDTPKAFNLFRMKFHQTGYSAKQIAQINEDIRAIDVMNKDIEKFQSMIRPKSDYDMEDGAEEPNTNKNELKYENTDLKFIVLPDTPEENPEENLLMNPEDEKEYDLFFSDIDNEPTTTPAIADLPIKKSPGILDLEDISPLDPNEELILPEIKSPIFITKEDEPFPLTGEWARIETTETIHALNANAQTLLPSEHPLPQAMPREYTHKMTETHLRESKENDLIKVNVSQEPKDYKNKTKAEQMNLDFILADSIINLLINRCGKPDKYPIEILDAANENRMVALILVCKERGFNYELMNKQHPVLSQSDVVNEKLQFMKHQITEETREKIEESRKLPAVNKEEGAEIHRMHR